MLSIAKSLVTACIFLMLAVSASINAAAPGFLEERRRMDTRLDAIVRKRGASFRMLLRAREGGTGVTPGRLSRKSTHAWGARRFWPIEVKAEQRCADPFRQILTRAREAQLDKRYILCRIYLNCHTSCANLSNQMERPIDDLTGRRFGRWIVLPREDIESNYRCRKWLVQCQCGKLRLVPGQDLLNGRSTSCGCPSRCKNTGDAKTSARSLALRTRLQRVMEEVRPERLEPCKTGGVPHN